MYTPCKGVGTYSCRCSIAGKASYNEARVTGCLTLPPGSYNPADSWLVPATDALLACRAVVEVCGLPCSLVTEQSDNMLNNGKSSYKALARKAELRECMTSDNPLSEIVVDFRSRLFMYIRTRYVNMPLKDKVSRLFRAVKDLEDEKKHVFRAALAATRMEVSALGMRSTYVFSSPLPCPYKSRSKSDRDAVASARLEEFRCCVKEFRSDMLNTGLLERCILALESYMISDLDSVCSVYGGYEWMQVPEAKCVVPGIADMYESDRTCARLGRQSAVLSEDFDCLALFGAGLMVKEAYKGFFSYTTLKDVMETFESTTRENLVEKCCLMGTDYNLGLKGVGPVKVKKIDAPETSRLCGICLSAQHINARRLRRFLLLD